MELVSIKGMSSDLKRFLLKELELSVDGKGYVTRDGERVLDKYTGQPIRMENMAIFPGSTIVLDDNPLSIASYIEEYGEV